MPTQVPIQIYGLIDMNTLELRYVGQTKDPLRRQKMHLRSYPGLRYIVLEQESIYPSEAETAWIVYASVEGAMLFNKRYHGYTSGRLGKHCSKEDKRKKSLALKGRPKSQAHIQAATIAYQKSALAKAHQNGKTAKIRSGHARIAANARWSNR